MFWKCDHNLVVLLRQALKANKGLYIPGKSEMSFFSYDVASNISKREDYMSHIKV